MKTKKTRTSRSLQSMVRHPALAELVNEQRKRVVEVLQLWGDFPDCNPEHCCSLDWLHVLQTRLTDLMEYVRGEDTAEGEQRLMRQQLAAIITTCEEWDRKLMGERMPNDPSSATGANSKDERKTR